MKRFERQLTASRIINYYISLNDEHSFRLKKTVRHFAEEGELSNTVYAVIRRYRKTGTDVYKPIGGSKRTVSTPEVTQKVVEMLNNTNTSVRECSVNLNLPKTTVQNIKKREGIKTYKCEITPKYTISQQTRAQKNCRKINRLATKKIIVIDDENYVPFDPTNTNVPMNYNCMDKNEVSDSVRFVGKAKHPKQILIWQAMDQFGNVSKPYLTSHYMTADEYRKECLSKRLLPFLKSKHKLSDILFWPDMASIHYAKSVREWLEKHKIKYVKRKDNAPNCPQVRPIERFWSFCKRDFSKCLTVSKSVEELRKCWLKVSRNVGKTHGKALMKGVRKKLRQVGKGGVYAPFKT